MNEYHKELHQHLQNFVAEAWGPISLLKPGEGFTATGQCKSVSNDLIVGEVEIKVTFLADPVSN